MIERDELIPLDQVLDDIYGDKGPISWAAENYYYTYYATPEQREKWMHHEKIKLIVSIVFAAAILVLGLATFIFSTLKF